MKVFTQENLPVNSLPDGNPYASLERSDKPFYILQLDEYEIVNLQRLFDAVSGKTNEDIPVQKFNNGDWVGQIGYYLPKTTGKLKPNMPYPEND